MSIFMSLPGTWTCGYFLISLPYLIFQVSISLDSVCDLSITCDDETDEMNCTDDRFYCENGEPLFVRFRQVS